MDGGSSKSLILGGFVEHPNCSFKRMKNELDNSSVMWKHPDENDILTGAHGKKLQSLPNNVASPLSHLMNEVSQAQPCTSFVQMNLDNPPASLAFCTAGLGNSPFFFECHPCGSQLCPPSRLSAGTVGMASSDKLLKATQAQHKLGYLYNVCQRKVVAADISRCDKRILHHHSFLDPFDVALPLSNLREVGMHDQVAVSEKYSDGNREILLRLSFPLATCVSLSERPANCGLSQEPYFAAMDSMSSTSENCCIALFADAEKAEVENKAELIKSGPEISYISHEDTKDIDALLSSDVDEVSSTGHSLSNLAEKNSVSAGPCSTPGTFSARSMKRKREEYDDDVDDDIRSTATSGIKPNNCCYSQNVIENGELMVKESSLHEIGLTRTMGYNSAALGMPIADEVSSNSNANNKRLCKRIRGFHQLQEPLVSPDLTRKEKIKNILHLLRRVIPGGECMDTAFVIDGVIQYVRTLQSEVHKLQEAKKLT